MRQITDTDVAKVKSLVKSGDIAAARKLLRSFQGERAAKLLAQLDEKYPSAVKSNPVLNRRPLMIGISIVVLIIIASAAAFVLQPKSTGPSTEMLEVYRDICIPLVSWEYETAGVDPQVIANGCVENARALYAAAPEAYTRCYEAMGAGDAASMAWSMCYSSYNVPTPAVWPISRLLSTRVVPTGFPTMTPLPPFASPQEGLVDLCLSTHQFTWATPEDLRVACGKAAEALYLGETSVLDQCFARKAGDQMDFHSCFWETGLEFDETYIDEAEVDLFGSS